MLNELEIFKQKLVERLTNINDQYTYNVELFSQYQKKKINQEKDILEDKEVFIVLNPLPSESYGSGIINLNIEMLIKCYDDYVEDVIDILSEYQISVINQRFFVDTTMINESWYSPTVNESFINMGIRKAKVISMTGTISFTLNVVDIQTLKVNNQEIKYTLIQDGTTAEVMPNNPVGGNGFKSSVNRGSLYNLSLRAVITNQSLFQLARQWKFGQIGTNTLLDVELAYTDGVSFTMQMKFDSIQETHGDGNVPVMAITLSKGA